MVKTTPSYTIERWDVLMFGTSIQRKPAIYIKPDLDFEKYSEANDYTVLVKISESQSPYDGKYFVGTVYPTCNVPNCRPNFYMETGYSIILLESNWNGYPKKYLGVASFPDMEKMLKENAEYIQHPVVKENLTVPITSSSPNKTTPVNTRMIIFLSLTLVILIALLILVFREK